MWVVQEALLAKNTRLVCGIKAIPDWMNMAVLVVRAGEEAQSSLMMFRIPRFGQSVLKPFSKFSRRW